MLAFPRHLHRSRTREHDRFKRLLTFPRHLQQSLPVIDVARWENFWWTFDHRRVVATKLAAQITGREFQLRVRVVHDLEGKGSDGVDYTEKMTTITAGTRIAVYDTEGHGWPVHFSKVGETSQILLDIVRKGVLI